MIRCYLDPSQWMERGEARLSPEETHHLVHVLRQKPGDAVELFDGSGRYAEACLDRIEGPVACVRLSAVRTEPPHPGPRRILAQALVKGERADIIVQKAVELGVDRIAWFAAERSVVQLNAARAQRRLARWRTLALQAARQCGRNRIPEISLAASVEDLCRTRTDGEAWFLCSLHPPFSLARDVLRADRIGPAPAICVAIGPEGDFTPAEEALIMAAGSCRITLGSNVLRSETAAIFILSVLAYEWD